MKKKLEICFLAAILPVLAQADQVATAASMSILQGQLNDLNQQINTAQQTLVTVSQNLQGMQKQSSTLRQEIAQYANTNAKQFKWVDVSDNQIPVHTFVAAENQGSSLYVCQAAYTNAGGYYGGNGSNTMMIPGVVTPTGCVITYNGQAYLEPDYAILTSTASGYWINGDQVKNNPSTTPVCPMIFARNSITTAEVVPAPSQSQPSDQPKPLYNALAIIGGQDTAGNTYICRVNINGQYFHRKNSSNTCFIATGAYEANWPIYQVLLTRQP